MAEFYSLISRAVADLPQNTGEARVALYERARNALAAVLGDRSPAMGELELARQRNSLEEAIRKVEEDTTGATPEKQMSLSSRGDCQAEATRFSQDVAAHDGARDSATAPTIVSQGHVGFMPTMFDNRADLNPKKDDGLIALFRASDDGHRDVVQALLEQGAEVNAKMDNGWTALMRASMGGHRDVVQVLLDNGADVNAKTSDRGETALMMASFLGKRDVVLALLDEGADVNARTNDRGETALLIASKFGYHEVVQALLGKGAEANARRNDGQTALDAAKEEGHAYVGALLKLAAARSRTAARPGWVR